MKKTVVLIDPSGSGLRPIKPHLLDINTESHEFSSVEDAEQGVTSPDLLIIYTGNGASPVGKSLQSLRESVTLSSVPRVFIGSPEFMKALPDLSGLKSEKVLPLFGDKLIFLSTLADIMKIPHRRLFKILIGLRPEDSAVNYSGISIDFSESGMAFESAKEFPEGKVVQITFINPKNRKRFKLLAEIVRVRSNVSGTQFFHGARFVSMSKEEKENLRSFVTGEA